VDEGAESPSWLPDEAAPGLDDVKSPSRPDPVGGGGGLPIQGYASDLGAPADIGAYAYVGETLHSNGRDTAFGQEGASVSAYGQESSLGGNTGSGPSYAPPLGEPPAPAANTAAPAGNTAGPAGNFTDTRTAGFPAIPRPELRARIRAKAPVTKARRADLVLARLEPWSVMKFSFLISLVAWVLLFVAVAVLYWALSALGVFDSIQRTLESVTSSSGSAGVSLSKWFSASRILGYTMLIGAFNIILITALSTVGAMIYNLVTHLGGGIEVTLRETD
jgi:hypothetical protein